MEVELIEEILSLDTTIPRDSLGKMSVLGLLILRKKLRNQKDTTMSERLISSVYKR
jgi:hypothetical protein